MADPVITTLRILGTRAYINGARASARAIREVGKASDETGKGMSLFKGTLGAVTGALGIMASAAKSASLILGALTVYSAKVGLEFDANIERSTVGLTTLLGNAKDAKKVVQDVTSFAVKAPLLSVADSIQSTQQLIGAGLKAKDAVPTMTAFSDTLSAMGRRPEDLQRMTYAFQQMLSKGQVSAEELRGQLGEIFPASRLMAKGMGISMKELADKMKAGEVKGKKPIMLLLKEMEKEFHGATKRSAQTFAGQLNNMKENAKVTLGLIWMPLFKGLRDKVFPWVNKVGQGIQDWAKGGGVDRLLDLAKTGFARPQAAGAPTELGGKKVKTKGTEGFLGKAMFKGGQLVAKILPEISKQAKALWDALKPAEPFVTNVLLPFVAGFAVGLYKGLIGLIPLIKIFAQVLGWIGQKAAPLKPVFAAIGFLIGYVFGPAKIGVFRVFGKVFEALGGPLTKVWGWLSKLRPVVDAIAGRLSAMAAKWFSIFTLMSTKVVDFVSAFVRLFGRIWGAASRIISKIYGAFKSFGGKVAGFISGSVGAVISAIVNWGESIATALWDSLPEWMKKLLGGVGGIVNAIKKSKPGGKAPRKGGKVGGLFSPGHKLPTRASGGPVSGLAMVGERGPEIADFGPGGFVYPQRQQVSMPDQNITLYAPIIWKGREVAKAIAEDTSDRKARR
jgi:tape measure domain-containing protein